MKPRIELIGTTGYAIRIQEDKSGQLIELHADGGEVLADIPESTLDNFAYTLNDDLGNMRREIGRTLKELNQKKDKK